MLELNNIDVHYGVIHALKNISLKVEKGEIVTLIGANGAGKTTTLRTISGLIKPSKGTITFKGQRIDGASAPEIVKAGISHVPEGRRIFPDMTVRENLELGAFLRKDKDEIQKDMELVFARFPILKNRSKQNAGTLSGGEQQMLAIGRGLMAQPSVLLLDEPSLGLAPIIVNDIFKIIKEIHKEGVTILLVEQNAKKAISISNRTYVLETGRIVKTGTGKELANDPEIIYSYLGGKR